jgi:hypothetical protein
VREPKSRSAREWERSALIEPRLGSRHPELISDGAGLPFPPSALAGPGAPLDPEDSAVSALLAYFAARTGPKRAFSAPWKRDATPPATPASLAGWRELARTDGEVLFGFGQPPRLVTVGFRQEGRRRTWTSIGSSSARPLRAIRDGIRASSWRPDPTHEIQPGDTVLRVLVTEQTFSSGQLAHGRVLVPDMYLDGEELVLRLFVSPRPGFQSGAPNPETAVRVALPCPVGTRRLIDGALAQFSSADAPPPSSSNWS